MADILSILSMLDQLGLHAPEFSGTYRNERDILHMLDQPGKDALSSEGIPENIPRVFGTSAGRP